jgi:hypothetical protein
MDRRVWLVVTEMYSAIFFLCRSDLFVLGLAVGSMTGTKRTGTFYRYTVS